MIKFENGWDGALEKQFASTEYSKLRGFLKEEYSTRTIYPEMFSIFNCFRITPYERVKAVLLGQDPYHNEGQAMGLSFSVPKGTAPPPSLVNIFKELQSDLGIKPPQNGDLTKWAERGALLLNTCLTVRKGVANSHSGKGWEAFTDSVIKNLSDDKRNLVFILWGNNARSKKRLIDEKRHLVIESAHPSPLSAFNGFFGSKPFSKTNAYLEKNNIEKIEWDLNK